MTALTLTLSVGLAATLVSMAVMYRLPWPELQSGDVIRATGSFFSHDEFSGLRWGFGFYILSGWVWTLVDIGLWSLFNVQTFTGYLGFGLVTGWFAGWLLAFAILLVWTEQHPVERFRKHVLRLALVNMLGHLIFATVLGIAAWSVGFRYDVAPLASIVGG